MIHALIGNDGSYFEVQSDVVPLQMFVPRYSTPVLRVGPEPKLPQASLPQRRVFVRQDAMKLWRRDPCGRLVHKGYYYFELLPRFPGESYD